MLFEEVAQVLGALDDSGVRHWVGGGWRAAVLVGRQTSEYRIMSWQSTLTTCRPAFRGSSISGKSDPDRLAARTDRAEIPGNRWVDVDPVKLDDNGHGIQSGLNGAHVDYPPSAFTTGTLNGRRIDCLSVQQQRDFHEDREH